MSGMTMMKEQPPFVRWEFVECGLNAEATKTAGRPIPAVKPFAFIMQHGSKDVVERDAEEWLAQIREKSLQGQYNPEWVERFQRQYEAFCKGQELPAEGTPVRTWPAPNREQVIRLLALGIQTVEQLSAIPDAGLSNIGLDGRHLRDLARNFIEAGHNSAGLAKKVADLEELTRQQAETIARLEAALPKKKAS